MDDILTENLTLVNVLVDNEKLLSKLYAIYAAMFPDNKIFWTRISQDETIHANWLYELLIKMKAGLVRIDPNRFKYEALIHFSDYINSQIVRTDKENITLIQALSVSMDMESSMIERNFFKVFETDSIELKNVFDRLRQSTEIHLYKIKEYWLEERKKLGIV